MALTRQHLLLDLWFQPPHTARLAYVSDWPEILTAAVERAGATILTQRFHQFEPQGVTGFLLLAESHLSLHTWPEENFAALDIFACGEMDIEAVRLYLRDHLHPCRESLRLVRRGELEGQKI